MEIKVIFVICFMRRLNPQLDVGKEFFCFFFFSRSRYQEYILFWIIILSTKSFLSSLSIQTHVAVTLLLFPRRLQLHNAG